MYTEEQKKDWANNRRLSTDEVISRIPEELKDFAFVVGKWVWIETPEKPSKELITDIKQLGFKFNFKRRVWQHPCGKFSKSAPYDPREKYGAVSVNDEGA